MANDIVISARIAKVDFDNLERISATLGIARSQAIRRAIHHGCERLIKDIEALENPLVQWAVKASTRNELELSEAQRIIDSINEARRRRGEPLLPAFGKGT